MIGHSSLERQLTLSTAWVGWPTTEQHYNPKYFMGFKWVFHVNRVYTQRSDVREAIFLIENYTKSCISVCKFKNILFFNLFVFILRNLSKFNNIELLKSTYYCLLQSHISYSIVLWRNRIKTETNFQLAKRCAAMFAWATSTFSL